MTPDATGIYEDAGEYGGQRYYERTPDGFAIWWHVTENWIISTAPGVLAPGHWYKLGPPIEGVYDPDGTYLGVATVTEI